MDGKLAQPEVLKDIWMDKLINVMVATSESEHKSQWSPEECHRVVRDRLAVLLLGVVVLYEVVQQGEDPEDAQHEEQLREQNLRGMRFISPCYVQINIQIFCENSYLMYGYLIFSNLILY